jgi:hypothetical protein
MAGQRTPPTPTLGRVGRLDRVGDIRAEMSRVYRLAARGLIPWADATRAVYVLDRIGRLAELSEIAERLDALEERQAEAVEGAPGWH